MNVSFSLIHSYYNYNIGRSNANQVRSREQLNGGCFVIVLLLTGQRGLFWLCIDQGKYHTTGMKGTMHYIHILLSPTVIVNQVRVTEPFAAVT